MPVIQITVRGSESERPEFRDVVNFLWDFNLAFELSLLAVDPKYEWFRFSNHVFQRNGRPVRVNDRLRLVSLTEESPLTLKTVATAAAGTAAALWVLVQSAQVVANWPLERAKLELEVRKTQLEVEKLEREAPPPLPVQTPPRLPDEARARDRELKQIETQLSLPRVVQPADEISRELSAYQEHVVSREADQIFSVIERFDRSPIRIEDVHVALINEEE